MESKTIILNIVCAASVCVISLISSFLYKREPTIQTEIMLFISFLPAFILGSFWIFNTPVEMSLFSLFAIFVKNFLYCLSFFLRYESLRKFGPFVGALMLGSQPVFLFLLGLVLLGERLTIIQEYSIIIASLSLFILIGNKSTLRRMSALDFLKYYLLPSLFSAAAIITDRYFLKDVISGNDYFAIDRLSLIPVTLLMLLLLKGKKVLQSSNFKETFSLCKDNWLPIISIGIFFTISGYAYTLALMREKAALVGLFRNSAYPMAAFIGAFIFNQKISMKEWSSLCLLFLSIYMASL